MVTVILVGHWKNCLLEVSILGRVIGGHVHFVGSYSSVLKPTDIVRFDEKVSPHELRTFWKNPREEDSDDDDFDFDNTFDTADGEGKDNALIAITL